MAQTLLYSLPAQALCYTDPHLIKIHLHFIIAVLMSTVHVFISICVQPYCSWFHRLKFCSIQNIALL